MTGIRERRTPQRLWGWGLALTALIAALAGISVLSASAYRQVLGTDVERVQAGALYFESYQTILAADAVYDALQDAERGQRGYALTQNPVFLEPYNENVALVAPRLATLEALTRDQEAQAARVASLRRIAELKLVEMADVVERLRQGRRSEAQREISSGYGRRLMSDIREIMEALRLEEQRLLDERREAVAASESEVSESIYQLAQFGGALLIAAFLATIGLGAMLLRANRSSQRERVVEEENAALEEAVTSRTRELVEANQLLISEAEARGSAEDRLRQAQRMEAIGQLTGGIAHDFNNMLAVVIGSLDLLKRRSKDEPKKIRLIDNALEGANRAATLTSRLLAFSRQQSLKPEMVDLNILVSGLKEFFDRTLNETIKVKVLPGEGTPNVFVDAAELENVLINLAANARDAMPRGGSLTISTSARMLETAEDHNGQLLEPGRYAVISVVDSGEGMSKEILQKVYEPFFTTKPVGKGTGLGLSQVHGFVLQSGGSIDIHSRPGEGTKIDLILPEGMEPEIIRKITPSTDGELPEARAGETVLIVEDQAQLRALTYSILKDLGYHVKQASSAGEALIALGEAASVDLLFTDIVMPDQSGEELARSARLAMPKLKLLYTSGYTQAAGVDAAALDPKAELLRKPYTVEQLALAIRRAIDD